MPRIALTATADELTRQEIVDRLGLAGAPTFVASFDRPNIRYEIVDKQNAPAQLKAFIAERHAGDAGIVYCLSRAKVEDTAAALTKAGVPALPYHAGPRRRPARAQPGSLHQRGRRRDRRHDRVRHGHRQARRALRRASRSAEKHRGLLSGDRPRRARRQAVQRLDGLWPVRHRAAAPHDRRDRPARKRSSACRSASSTRWSASPKPPIAAAPACSAISAKRSSAARCGNCDNCLSPPRVRDGKVDRAKAVVLRLSHRAALRRHASDRCPDRPHDRTRQAVRA